MSKVIKIEIPYLWSFIEHYKRLGVNKIYLLSTNRSDYQEIRDYLVASDDKIFTSLVTLIDEEIPSDQLDECANLVKIVEDYVLNVDIDEFLEIDPPDLQALLLRTPANYYNFRWVMVPNDDYLNRFSSNMKLGFLGHTGKYMVKTAICRKFTPHAPMLTENTMPVETGRLIHYWGRSFKDTVFKCCYQRYRDAKNSSLQEVHGISQTGVIPKRLKLLALLCRKLRTVSLKHAYLSIDHDYERKLELEFQLNSSLDGIYQRYEHYKSSVTDNMIDLYPRIPLMQLAKLL